MFNFAPMTQTTAQPAAQPLFQFGASRPTPSPAPSKPAFGGKGGATAPATPTAPTPTAPTPTATPYTPTPAAPVTMQQSQNPNVFTQAAGAYNQALQGPNIAQFQNPYTQQVVDRTMADMDRARQMTMNGLGAQASAAGAFGGSRHGIAEAETNRAFADQAGNMSANLNMQGFNTALGAAQQQQQMQSQLAGQGFGFGQALNQQQMQQGTMQQALMQQLINAARGQYQGFTGAPLQSLQMPLAAVGAANMGQSTTTQSSNPGLFGILGAGASLLGAF